MKVLIRETAPQVQAVVAARLEAAIRGRPDIVLGLATGRTMEAVYALLAARHRARAFDVSRLRSFNLDEYVGLDGGDARSYAHYMRRHLFDALGLDARRGRLPDGAAVDAEAQADRYEAAIDAAGGIDLQLLGLGENGHIGFNEPFSGLSSRTRVVTLDRATLVQNAAMFGGDPACVPGRAITMGVGTILAARRIVLAVTGAAKAAALAEVVEGPLCARVPGSALQMHADCWVVADEAAAAALRCRPGFDWQMAHDPELRHVLDTTVAA